MQVPFVDLKKQYATIKTRIDEAVGRVISESAFIGGKYVQRFEAEFSAFCAVRHCIGVGNGTDALFIALRSLGIGPGDEVITVANSFIATAEAITMTGARVVFVDCNPETYNLDIDRLLEAITPKTKAIVPVHLYGQPADMPRLREVADAHGLKLVEDAAQAHGATIAGQRVGTFGDLACFSFYPGKNLGAYGDAGAIVTNSDDLALKCRMIANHGRVKKYDHDFEGVNSRLDGLQAAILSVKLERLDAWTGKRRAHARTYGELLQGVNVVRPKEADGVEHVYHLYVIRVKNRDAVQSVLREHGIATGIHYPIALPNLEAYRYLKHVPTDFPQATRLSKEILSLPMYAELETEQIEHVCRSLRAAVARGGEVSRE